MGLTPKRRRRVPIVDVPKLVPFNLAEYLKKEFREGKVEFCMRAHVFKVTEFQQQVEIYIHPLGKDGDTSPTLVVAGNRVSEKEWRA